MRSNITKVVLFLLVGMLLFSTVQGILTPNFKSEAAKPNLQLRGFETLEDGAVDAVFVGASNILYGVSPMKIYEEYGFCTYNLGTASQSIELSYSLLHKVFEEQSPSVVFFDARGFYGKSPELTWWYILNNLEFGRQKIKMAMDYGELDYGKGFATAMLPILLYHSRWNELTEKDFLLPEEEELYYSGGLMVDSRIYPIQYSVEMVNANAVEMRARDPEMLNPDIQESKLVYFEKILSLCQQNNAQLVLFTVPAITLPQQYANARTYERYQAIKTIAQEYDVPYIDLLYDDTVVDYSRDFVDEGYHLNLRGAEAVSTYLGKYISDNYDLPVKQNAQYDEMLADYRKIRYVANLQMETDFTEYLKMLEANKEKWTIVITTHNDYTSGLRTYNTELLASLGLTQILDGAFADSYAAIISEGKVIYEELSNKRIEYNTQTENGLPISLCSSGWYSIPHASTQINSLEYAGNSEGINIVVYDHESGLVIDSAYCNTRYENSVVKHVDSLRKLLAYEGNPLE